MRILISGATGLIGREIVDLCHSQGISVNYLSTSKDKIVSRDNYKGFYWNPSSGEIDMDCFYEVDAIINLAGSSISQRWTSDYKKEIMSSRVNTVRTLYHALKKVDSDRITSFVSASAIGIYPNSLTSYYSEDEREVDQSFLGEVVLAWEKEIDTLISFGFSVSKIRIGLVMSSGGGALPEMAKPIKNYIGTGFGSGEQWQSWIHIRDLARIFLFSAENRLQGTYNGVGPNPVTNNKLIKEIAKILERPLLLPNIPRFVMKAILGEMSYILFASQRVSSKKIEEEGFVFHHKNICKTLENIYDREDEKKSPDKLLQKEFLS